MTDGKSDKVPPPPSAEVLTLPAQRKNHFGDLRIGQRLRMRRLILGLSQKQLATAIGVSTQLIQKYERGAVQVSASKLHQLSQALHVGVSFFFEPIQLPAVDTGSATLDTVDGRMSQVPDEVYIYDDTMELVKIFWKISDETTRRHLLVLIRAIAKSLEKRNVD